MVKYIVFRFFQTGTLTEDGLDMHSVVPAHDGKYVYNLEYKDFNN